MTIQAGTRTTAHKYAAVTGSGPNGLVTLRDLGDLVAIARAEGIPGEALVEAPGFLTISPVSVLRFRVDVVEDTGATPGEATD